MDHLTKMIHKVFLHRGEHENRGGDWELSLSPLPPPQSQGEFSSGFLRTKIETPHVCFNKGNFSISLPSYTSPLHRIEN